MKRHVQKTLQPIDKFRDSIKRRSKVSAVIHDKIFEPLVEKPLSIVSKKASKWVHDNIFLEGDKKNWKQPEFVTDLAKEMSGKSKKGKKKKTTKKVARAMAVIAAGPDRGFKGYKKAFKAVARGKKNQFKRGAVQSVIGATRAPLPKMLKMRTSAGLSMKGGWISGVTEIVPDLVLSATQNVAGTVLYTSYIHPLLLAPGSRFADLSENYDLYDMEEFSVTLGSDIPFTVNGMIGGGLERDPLDPLPAAGGILDVPKYMEHENFHAESMANRRGVKFPKNQRAVNAIRGPYSGFSFNRIPAVGNLEVATLVQGQIVIFVHTALGDATGPIDHDISLGPLTMRWKVHFKSAAEKRVPEGSADFHNMLSPTAEVNPFNWTEELVRQESLDSKSTLNLASRYTATARHLFQLPKGDFFIILHQEYSASGAAQFAIAPYAVGQTGLEIIERYSTFDSLKLSAINLNAFTAMWVRVTGPNPEFPTGEFLLFHEVGDPTDWVVAVAHLRIISLPPPNATLFSRDHVTRSLAQAKLRVGHVDQIKLAVEEALRAAGIKQSHEKKESSLDKLIEQRHQFLLKSPVPKKPKPDEETKQEWLAEHFADQAAARDFKRLVKEQEDWDDLEEPKLLRQSGGSKVQWTGKRFEQERKEEKAPIPPRASSLKS
jgi:hypothetical protein